MSTIDQIRENVALMLQDAPVDVQAIETGGIVAQRLDEHLHVSSGESLHASLMRSMGARLADVGAFFGSSILHPEHAIIKGEWQYFVHGLAPLQRAVNMLNLDAGTLLTESVFGVPQAAISNLTIGRALVKACVTRNMSIAEVVNLGHCMAECLPAAEDYDEETRARVASRWADQLPDGRRVEIADHLSPWSVVMALAGMPARELIKLGVNRGAAGAIANGRRALTNITAIDQVASECIQLGWLLAPIADMVDETATDEQAGHIADLTPAQMITAWQLFPIARPEIEKHTPYLATPRA